MNTVKKAVVDIDGGDRPKTLVEDAYLRLREDIIEGKYESGARLRVEHLKDNYGVGAGTLREALSLLVADSLVATEGQRGFSVTPLSLDDLDDLTHTRILLETEALRLALRKGSDDWEAELVAAFHRLTKVEERFRKTSPRVREWEDRNKSFHEALIDACGSRWLRHMLAILYRQAERYRHFSITKSSVKRDIHAEHTEIFEAALRRDEKRAVEALTRHVDLTRLGIHKMAPDWLRKQL
jgi:DNA-binding GntR family transcriptional regulator